MNVTLKDFTLKRENYNKEWMEVDYLRDTETHDKYLPDGLAIINGGKYIKVLKVGGERLYLPPSREVRILYKSDINSIPSPTHSPQYNLCTIIGENKEMLKILEKERND